MMRLSQLTVTVFFAVLFSILAGCNAQVKQKAAAVESDLENTHPEIIGMPNILAANDTSPGWSQQGQKMIVTGTVFETDGKTPASNVVVYYYHTNTEGKYLHKKDHKKSLPPNSKGQTHGYIRGWIKTGSDGKYSIATVRPGTYPSGDEPAHIHLVIKEPGAKESYYIDDFVFDDDMLLTAAKRKRMENRGGSGILRMLKKGELQVAEHNIILGLNIPGYPKTKNTGMASGLQIGEDQPSFIPFHAYGPDKGTRTCPVCKYGRYHGIVYFVGDHADWNDIKKWLTYLELQSETRKKYLKAYFVYGNSKAYDKSERIAKLEKAGIELNIKNVALTFVPSFSDTGSEAYLNRINPAVENTFIVYKNRTIIDKYVDLKPTEVNFRLISTVLDSSKGEYFDLPEPVHVE